MLLSSTVNKDKLRKLQQIQQQPAFVTLFVEILFNSPSCEGYLLTNFQIIRKVRE